MRRKPEERKKKGLHHKVLVLFFFITALFTEREAEINTPQNHSLKKKLSLAAKDNPLMFEILPLGKFLHHICNSFW